MCTGVLALLPFLHEFRALVGSMAVAMLLHNIFELAEQVFASLASLMTCMFSDGSYCRCCIMDCMESIVSSCVPCLDSETSEYECATSNSYNALLIYAARVPKSSKTNSVLSMLTSAASVDMRFAAVRRCPPHKQDTASPEIQLILGHAMSST